MWSVRISAKTLAILVVISQSLYANLGIVPDWVAAVSLLILSNSYAPTIYLPLDST
jgi:hypothetical protein